MARVRAVLELVELPQRVHPAQLGGAGLVPGLVPILPPGVEILGLLEATRPRQAIAVPVPIPFPVVRPVPVVVRLIELRVIEIPVAIPIILDALPAPIFYSLGRFPPTQLQAGDQADISDRGSI